MFYCSECGEVSGGEERRERLIQEMVAYKIAASDAARDLLHLIADFGASDSRYSKAMMTAALSELHARMARSEAEDDNDIHNIINRLDPISRELDRLDRQYGEIVAPIDDALAEARQQAATEAMAETSHGG